jgi:hypothetical protein
MLSFESILRISYVASAIIGLSRTASHAVHA